MQPLGNHIQINAPEELTRSDFILEKEAVVKATVGAVSPDVSVPFTKGDTVYFYTRCHIMQNDGIFVNIEMIVGYLPATTN